MELDPTRSFQRLPFSTGYPKIYLDAFGSSNGRNTTEYLWYPSPDPSVGEVQIGDIGVVQEGAFCRLWNIVLPFEQEEGINVESPPPGFIPPRFDPGNDVISHEGYMKPYEPFCSKGITYKRKTTETMEGTSQLHDVYTFSAANVQAGGVIIPLTSATRIRLKDSVRKSWESLLESNRKAWKKYSQCQTYPMDELLLVTGCIKTATWVIAAVKGDGDFDVLVRKNYQGRYPIGLRESPTLRGSAQSCIGQVEATLEINQIRATAGMVPLPIPGFDQCLAIEARRFAKRDTSRTWTPPDIFANAEPQDPSYDRDDHAHSAVLASDPVLEAEPGYLHFPRKTTRDSPHEDASNPSTGLQATGLRVASFECPSRPITSQSTNAHHDNFERTLPPVQVY